jgi:hypothetical protein
MLPYLTCCTTTGSENQFIFELSYRQQEAKNDRSLFLTYKGTRPGLINDTKDELRCQTEFLSSTNEVIMFRNVPINNNATLGDTAFDDCASFPDDHSRPALIDISMYGIKPFKSQDLTYFKEFLSDFVNGYASEGDEYTCNFMQQDSREFSYNVTVHRLGVRDAVYILHLSHMMEKGQTIQVQFPPVAASMLLAPLRTAKWSHRILIDHTLRFLSVDDLKSVLNWLRDNFLNQLLSSVDPVVGDSCNPKVVYDIQRRLCWLARRIADSFGGSIPAESGQIMNDMESSWEILKKNCNWHEEYYEVLRTGISRQVTEELRFFLDGDQCCCSELRGLWCERAQSVLDLLCEIMSHGYAYQWTHDQILSKVTAVIDKELGKPFGTDLIQTLSLEYNMEDQFLTNDMLEQYTYHILLSNCG